jgi:C-terminal processing protease CtpA/Prc
LKSKGLRPDALVEEKIRKEEGPIVEQIDEDSPLKDTLAVGDCIDSVDGVDTARMNEEAFAALLGVNSHEVRKLVVRARSA